MSRRNARPPLGIDDNRRLLNRYRFIAHESLRLLAGWLPATATFELKCEFGRAVWEHSLFVNALYLRLREIQSPAFQPPDDPALLALLRELPHAPGELAVAHAHFGVLLPDLIAALERHESATFANSDLPSIHALRHALLDLRAATARVEPLLAAHRLSTADRAWLRYVRALLAAAGGADGRRRRPARSPVAPVCRREFRAPREAARDARFTQRGADFAAMPPEDNYAAHTAEEFERYSTELLAAETVALVLHAVRGMPWEFEFDLARHLYDEVRHCLMGCEWMRRRGLDPFAAPQFLHVFRWRSQFPPELQYCFLTMGNEVHAFPYRHRRVEAHRQSGDVLSEQFVRYDIADETQHVRFGHRWLPELLRHVGEKRPVKKYTAAALKIWESEYRTGKLPVHAS